jgi:hypothetical protein
MRCARQSAVQRQSTTVPITPAASVACAPDHCMWRESEVTYPAAEGRAAGLIGGTRPSKAMSRRTKPTAPLLRIICRRAARESRTWNAATIQYHQRAERSSPSTKGVAFSWIVDVHKGMWSVRATTRCPAAACQCGGAEQDRCSALAPWQNGMLWYNGPGHRVALWGGE